MNINQLPDLCLICIFDKLPILDLLKLNFVCRRWAEIQQAVCLKKQSLKICDLKMANFWLDQLEFYQMYENDFDLVVQYELSGKLLANLSKISKKFIVFNSKTCNCLIEKFPNIKRLTISNYTKSPIIDGHLVEMLSAWNKMTHLKIHGYMNWDTIEPYINLLTNLKYFSSWVSLAKLSKLTICPQFSEFYCKYSKTWNVSNNDWDENDLTVTLTGLVSKNVRQFGLHIPYKDDFKNFPISVIQKFTRIAVKLDSLEELSYIASNWKCLKYLNLEFTNKNIENPLQEILSRLVQLEYLQDLRLDIINKFNQTETINFLSDFSSDQIPKVLWCKNVQFMFQLDPHKLSQLEVLFPNAENLSFRILSCDDLTGLFCNQSCQNCGHIEALVSEYGQMLRQGQINSFIIDFAFKFGKIISHNVRFG